MIKVERQNLGKNDGVLIIDEEKRQGNFYFYFAKSDKIVIYDVYEDKNNTLQMSKNKRWNNNVNIPLTTLKEALETLAGLGGITPTKPQKKPVRKPEAAGVVLNKDISKIGV